MRAGRFGVGGSRREGCPGRSPPLSELQDIVGETDEAALGGDLLDAAQQELASRLVELLERAGVVVMKRPAEIGAAALGRAGRRSPPTISPARPTA